MASYSIVMAESAVDDLLAVPFPFRRQINQHLHKLKSDPRPDDAETVLDPLSYRLNVTGWWIVFDVDDDAARVTILAILPADS